VTALRSAAAPVQARLTARALLLGARIDTRGLAREEALAPLPLTVRVGERGTALVFRYGVVVLFDAEPAQERAFIAGLDGRIAERLAQPDTEQAEILVKPEGEEPVDASGAIVLRDAGPERLQVVASVLSKSVVLAHYEARIAAVFDRIEPLADRLRRDGRTGTRAKELLQQIGEVLLTQQRMVGRVEVGEKPEVLWDHPGLERLYARLEDEYELSERGRAIERKLGLVSDTVETLVDLVQNKRSTRLEWYIIALIAIEIALTLYELFWRGHG
jgi:uncharacterized Rmd1/YagE family protein